MSYHTCLKKTKRLETKENNLSWSFNRYSLPLKSRVFELEKNVQK